MQLKMDKNNEGVSRMIFSDRERKPLAESFLKFKYDLNFPPEFLFPKAWREANVR